MRAVVADLAAAQEKQRAASSAELAQGELDEGEQVLTVALNDAVVDRNLSEQVFVVHQHVLSVAYIHNDSAATDPGTAVGCF